MTTAVNTDDRTTTVVAKGKVWPICFLNLYQSVVKAASNIIQGTIANWTTGAIFPSTIAVFDSSW